MKRVLVVVAALGAAVIGIDVLGDATQTRPDRDHPDSRSEIVFAVETNYGRDRAAAEGLWGACQGTALRNVLPPGLTETDDGNYRLVLQPALGRHARDRMTGCLEDVTLDNVKGRVVSIRELPQEKTTS